MKKILCLLYLLSIFCFSHAQNENTYLEQKIDSTLSGMTIREKAGQLNQLDGRGTIENLKILITDIANTKSFSYTYKSEDIDTKRRNRFGYECYRTRNRQ